MSQQADATAIWDRRYGSGEAVQHSPVTAADLQYLLHPFLWNEGAGKRLIRPDEIGHVLGVSMRHMRPPIKRMLALGSGPAVLEEWMVRAGFVEHMTVYEASAVVNAAAMERMGPRTDVPETQWYSCEEIFATAPKNGDVRDRFEFRSQDALHDNLPSESFDAIFVQAAIHHFFEIEEMYRLMHRVLKPGGLLFFDETIGPDRLIYPPEVYALMDEIDACLAPELRYDVLQQKVREGVARPTEEQMIALDPSECVHSSRILPLTYQYFDVIERRDYGGAVLRPFFAGILRNFDWDSGRDRTIGRLIVLLETVLMRYGALAHDSTRVVARKREVPRHALTEDESARIGYEDWPGLAGMPPKEPMYVPTPIFEQPVAPLSPPPEAERAVEEPASKEPAPELPAPLAAEEPSPPVEPQAAETPSLSEASPGPVKQSALRQFAGKVKRRLLGSAA